MSYRTRLAGTFSQNYGRKNVRFGKPVIKATRVPIDMILGKGAGDMTYDEVMSAYDLVKEDILAVLEYAAEHLSEEEVRAIA